MVEQAKHDFIKLASAFRSEALQSDSIATVRCVLLWSIVHETEAALLCRLAQHVLLGEGEKVKDRGSGLDLIFRKLNELKKKARALKLMLMNHTVAPTD